jgi:hypothetical protein
MITTAALLKASVFSSGYFGIHVAESTHCILQDLAFERSGKEITPATNEVGAEIGTGVMGGNIANVTGNYLYNGSTIAGTAGAVPVADIGAALTLASAATFALNGDVLLVTFGVKLNHEAWEVGDFKAINLDTATKTVTS